MIEGDRLDWMRTERRFDVGSYEQNFTGYVPSGIIILRMTPFVTSYLATESRTQDCFDHITLFFVFCTDSL
jgi:hypothetical protein